MKRGIKREKNEEKNSKTKPEAEGMSRRPLLFAAIATFDVKIVNLKSGFVNLKCPLTQNVVHLLSKT